MNGLKALDSIRCDLSLCPNHSYKESNALCNTVEKELKALEIIKRKVIMMNHLKGCFRITEKSGCGTPLEAYNFDKSECDKLTQNEFDLLKEVLEC